MAIVHSIRAAVAADAPAIARVHVAGWRESYAGMVPDAMLADLSVESRTAMWERILGEPDGSATAVFVAECRGEAVGFGLCGAQRSVALREDGFVGEFSAIYVLGAFQGGGIGRALMRAMASGLADRGLGAASLWVLRDNAPARAFYERIGGVLIGEREDRRGDVVLAEVAYGWRDLGRLRGLGQGVMDRGQ